VVVVDVGGCGCGWMVVSARCKARSKGFQDAVTDDGDLLSFLLKPVAVAAGAGERSRGK